jgi:hypothetical protein
MSGTLCSCYRLWLYAETKKNFALYYMITLKIIFHLRWSIYVSPGGCADHTYTTHWWDSVQRFLVLADSGILITDNLPAVFLPYLLVTGTLALWSDWWRKVIGVTVQKTTVRWLKWSELHLYFSLNSHSYFTLTLSFPKILHYIIQFVRTQISSKSRENDERFLYISCHLKTGQINYIKLDYICDKFQIFGDTEYCTILLTEILWANKFG